jgi:hypothetical protein
MMTHYARLAALSFRFLAVVALLYTLPALFMGFGMTRMMNGPQGVPVWAVAGAFLYPIMAVLLFLVARPLGNLVARGLE